MVVNAQQNYAAQWLLRNSGISGRIERKAPKRSEGFAAKAGTKLQ